MALPEFYSVVTSKTSTILAGRISSFENRYNPSGIPNVNEDRIDFIKSDG